MPHTLSPFPAACPGALTSPAIASSRPPLRDAARLRVERYFAEGAVFSFLLPEQTILVGELRWAEPDGLLLFAGNGDSPRDAYFVSFDSIEILPDASVGFLRHGRMVGRLQQIDQADVEDPDDFRIGWQLWQCVAPLRRRLIDRCLEDAEGRARGVAR